MMANQIEQQEMASLPAKYQPLGMWAFFGYTILFSIPLVGIICVIVFSFSNTNICRRNFARSYFCIWIIGLIISVLYLAMVGTGAISTSSTASTVSI